jgi:hypothetical protein
MAGSAKLRQRHELGKMAVMLQVGDLVRTRSVPYAFSANQAILCVSNL